MERTKMDRRAVRPSRKISSMAGLTRFKATSLYFTEEEHEYVARIAFDKGQSANALMRTRILKNGWREELYDLKMRQPGSLAKIDGRRK